MLYVSTIMLNKLKPLGSATTDPDNKVTVIKNVAKILEVNKGDIWLFMKKMEKFM
jgi:hypothetical protein